MREIIRSVEIGSFVAVGLAPVLYWVNGTAVSTDQFVVRMSVTAAAAVVGTVLLGVEVFLHLKHQKNQKRF